MALRQRLVARTNEFDGRTTRIYKTALERFKTNDWRDKLARFFVREKRDAEFAEFCEDLIGKLNDADVQNYLSQFVDGKMFNNDFDRQLYLKLYQSAHESFPHNQLLSADCCDFIKRKNQEQWRKLAAEYYFESPMCAKIFSTIWQKNDLRNYLRNAPKIENTIYELFRADASVHLSNFENAVAAYRNFNEFIRTRRNLPKD